ncbi:PREDICTED: pyrroline-5-carboxylate reductase [Prunus dulcis]|uniref:PREDICTED: pyrroline-5-carboxylate reductase n=1 Tax=Prunus dulcis TaxID=3755 RepID=A0A5E4FA93_PRUDU|nr:hypothetical protein L3X38_037734 [Prunus dulcis]VVA23939.1 PREDICTED: pyrroline-5-carboxylate reductase [Prunus dulcis]
MTFNLLLPSHALSILLLVITFGHGGVTHPHGHVWQLRPLLSKKKLLVPIAAGVKLKDHLQVLGAASMVTSTGKHPGQLENDVTSPAGTTIAGIHELEKGGFRGILTNAVLAAARRSREFSQSQ